MEFVKIFWKNIVQEPFFPKITIFNQIVSEMLAGYAQKTQHTLFQVFLGRPQKKIRRVLYGVF